MNGTGEATFLHAEGSAEAGLGGDIVGVSAEGAVSYAEAKGEIKVGTDDFNGTGKVDAKLLSAEGYAKCYVKKDEWGFGVGGEGTTAEVSASANVDFLHVKAKDSSTGHDEHLFSIGASPKLTAGVGGEASISGKKVIDTDFIDVHTVNVKLGGKLGLGLALDITLPYIWAD